MTDTAEITFTKVAELYVEELRCGKRPQLQTFIQAFPHLKDDILGCFPALAVLEGSSGRIGFNEGERLGNYSIEKEIGRGGMGVVYEAKEIPGGQRVAVKVIPLKLLDIRAQQRFEHERLAMMRLSHANILPVHSHGYNCDYAYLVLKLIDGSSLAQILQKDAGNWEKSVLKNWRTNWNELARIASQIASGLHHAHTNDVVHRDIKPGNLLLDKSGKIWISDFGLAKLKDSSHAVSQTGDVIGTPRYMAPEQNQGICDVRSDIYSLGATIYELACGERACIGNSPGSVIINKQSLVVADVRSINPDIPRELAKIVMKACEYHPERRYQSAEELMFVLNRFRCGHSIADRRSAKRLSDDAYKLNRTRKLNRATSIALALSGLAILFVLGSYALPKHVLHRVQDIASVSFADVVSGRESLRLSDFSNPTQKLIDQLGNGENEDVVEVVSGVLSQSVKDHAVQHWNYSSEAQDQLLTNIELIAQKFKSEELSDADMESFVRDYRKSSVAIASRLLQITPQIEMSLDSREKQRAHGLLARFSAAIINRAIPSEESEAMIEDIIRGRFTNLESSAKKQIPAPELRAWLNGVEKILEQLPPQTKSRHKQLPEELKSLFEEHFGISQNQ